ncbi:unnamed protein product [Coffea canephora]|uniref:Uncharacterized protein n=1 Tax=Coffea canephora TaxID=49390 RepID=A0A068U1X6_COFCA|nr:unnamed protein product [Coffea canephora]
MVVDVIKIKSRTFLSEVINQAGRKNKLKEKQEPSSFLTPDYVVSYLNPISACPFAQVESININQRKINHKTKLKDETKVGNPNELLKRNLNRR